MSSRTRRTIFITLLILSVNRQYLSSSLPSSPISTSSSSSSSSASSSAIPTSWFVAADASSASVSPLPSESESAILADDSSVSGLPSAPSPHLVSPYASAQTSSVSLPKFRILAIIPNEKAVLLSRELRSAVARWQTLQRERNVIFNAGGGGASAYPGSVGFSVSGIGNTNLSVDDTSLILSPIPAGNDTQRLLETMCQSFEMHNPSLILTLLEPRRTYYLKMIAKKVDIPILSLSSEYRESFQLFQSRLPDQNQQSQSQHLISGSFKGEDKAVASLDDSKPFYPIYNESELMQFSVENHSSSSNLRLQLIIAKEINSISSIGLLDKKIERER